MCDRIAIHFNNTGPLFLVLQRYTCVVLAFTCTAMLKISDAAPFSGNHIDERHPLLSGQPVGKVHFSSTVNVGATFSFGTLPFGCLLIALRPVSAD